MSRYECDNCDWRGNDPIEVEPRVPGCPECGSDMLFDFGEEEEPHNPIDDMCEADTMPEINGPYSRAKKGGEG